MINSRLTRGQGMAIIGFSALFIVLLVGFDTVSPEQRIIEKSRSLNIEKINIRSLIAQVKNGLTAQTRNDIEILEERIAKSQNDSTKSSHIKELAAMWFKEGQPLISGHYAGEVAQIDNTPESWSIAGTTYALASRQSTNEMDLSYCIEKAREYYENAISLDPGNVPYKINLALSYVDHPLSENPMKGIMMMMDLNRKYPENPSVLFHLGRLSLETNQLEKAVERLEASLRYDSLNSQAHCLLEEVYLKLGKPAQAELHGKKC